MYRRYQIPLLIVTVAALAGCSSNSSPGAEADGKSDARKSCDDCATALDLCEKAADDTASINACISEFASCHVDATGAAVRCEDESVCGDCQDDSSDRASLIEMTHCIVSTANLTADRVCRGAGSCETCAGELARCESSVEDTADINNCLRRFGECHVAVTGRPVACSDESVCGECLDDSTDSASLADMSHCILLTTNAPATDVCGDSPRTCLDCAQQMEACEAGGSDVADINGCISLFARCHVAATGQPIACSDESVCGECLDDATDVRSLVAMSECIVTATNTTAAAVCAAR